MKVLMIHPTYFRVTSFFMNPYMTGEKMVNIRKAQKQWQNLADLLTSLGVTVIKRKGIDGLVDMVFAANAGTIVDNYFFPSNFYYPERKLESNYYQQYLMDRSIFRKGY